MGKLPLRVVAVLGSLLMVSQLIGCQMSASSSRIFASMASIWSLSASFQSSFGGRAGLDEDYARDVAAVSAAIVSSETEETALLRNVTRVAEEHGVTDWEALDSTWLGMGIGLRHAGLSEPEAVALVARVFEDPNGAETVAVVWNPQTP
jgi:hypothetical protein